MQGGFWTRQSWKFLLILTAVIGLYGIVDVLGGLDAFRFYAQAVAGLTPDEIRATNQPIATLIDAQVRAGGIQLVVIGLLWSAILLVPFRRGERWAWYASWTFPLWSVAAALSWLFVDRQPGEPPPPPAISGWVFFVLTAALLWASRGAFHRPQDIGTTERG